MKGPDKPPKRKVQIDTGVYLIRSIGPDDASDQWGSWMADPEVAHMLNIRPRGMTRDDIVAYVKTFDQCSNLLLGIFEKHTGSHVGFFTINADYLRSQGLVNLLIGEAAHRNRGVLSEIRRYFAEYFFETLGLKTMMATALAHNRVIVDTLMKGGWKADRVLKDHVTPHSGGPKLDLLLMSLSHEAWRARNKAEAGKTKG